MLKNKTVPAVGLPGLHRVKSWIAVTICAIFVVTGSIFVSLVPLVPKASATSGWKGVGDVPYGLSAYSQVTGAANHVVGVNLSIYYPTNGTPAFLYVAFSAAGLPGQAKCSRGPYYWKIGSGGVPYRPFGWTIPVNQYCATGPVYVDWELAVRIGNQEIQVVWEGTSTFEISPFT